MIRIDDYLIDLAEEESVTYSSDPTPYPVEDGADVTDHVRARPLTISITGIVSDTPLGAVARERQLDDDAAFFFPSDEAFSRLRAIHSAREPVTLELKRGTFTNMVMTEFSERRDSSSGDALRFGATFTQIRIVTNERAIVVVAAPRGKPQSDYGYRAVLEQSLANVRAAEIEFNRTHMAKSLFQDAKVHHSIHKDVVPGTLTPGLAGI